MQPLAYFCSLGVGSATATRLANSCYRQDRAGESVRSSRRIALWSYILTCETARADTF